MGRFHDFFGSGIFRGKAVFEHDVLIKGCLNGLPINGPVGNVYFVVQTAQAYYQEFFKHRRFQYHDGSFSLYLDIQSALDVCVADRNDYVFVWPDGDDYDLTATLTMTKKAVHLICPAGLSDNGIGMNAARLDCTTNAPAVTITGDCLEFAGFFIKGYLNAASLIYLSGTRWHDDIHHNFVGIKASSAGSANYGIFGDGACSHCGIHHNYVTTYSPAALTGADNAVAGGIVFTSSSCTRNVISDNIVSSGANTAMALGIQDVGDQTLIARNYVIESQAFTGVTETGTLTKGINYGASSICIDNKVGIATEANALVGGTADATTISNYEATNGGTLAV